MDQKNWYCKNGYTEISIKIPITFFTELEKNSSHPAETQNTPNKQSNSEQKEQCWRCTNYYLKLLLRTIATIPAQQHHCQGHFHSTSCFCSRWPPVRRACSWYSYLITRLSVCLYLVFLLAISIFASQICLPTYLNALCFIQSFMMHPLENSAFYVVPTLPVSINQISKLARQAKQERADSSKSFSDSTHALWHACVPHICELTHN